MIDTQHINLLALIGLDTNLKRVASTNGGEYHGACPVCGGKDRFIVQPNKDKPSYWCRQCDNSGDAIQYLQWTHGLSFKDAMKQLNLPNDLKPLPQQRDRRPAPRERKLAETSDPWQNIVQRFTAWSSGNLLNNSEQLNYLHSRGIILEAVKGAQLGYNPNYHATTIDDGIELHFPSGIVIPTLIDDRYLRIKIRTGTGEYRQLKGGANVIYNADAITPDSIVIIVEAELDALTIQSQLLAYYGQCDDEFSSQYFDKLIAVATGTTTGAHNDKSVARCAMANRVLIAFDADDPGDEAATWWLDRLGSKAQRLRPNGAKDPGDMMKDGYSIGQWIQENIK
jgi:DNA primase